MKLQFTADITHYVMRNAMIFMAQALDAERPLNDLERLGWLVVCKYIVDRSLHDTPEGEAQTMNDMKFCKDCKHWKPCANAPQIGACEFPVELPKTWPAAYLNRDGTPPTIGKFAMSSLNGGGCQTFLARQCEAERM